MKNVPRLLTLLPAVLLCVLPSMHSQAAAGPTLYKVEVIVFERVSQQDLAETRERWPRDVHLAYPANTERLRQPQPLEGSLDSAPQGPQPFERLSASEKGLGKQNNALARDRSLRVLFHEAWLQPLPPPRNAIAVHIEGGETFGGNRELNGTITLSLGRFIELQTNLWLAKFAANNGQLPEMWSPLPLLGNDSTVNVQQSVPSQFAQVETLAAKGGSGNVALNPTEASAEDGSAEANASSPEASKAPYLIDQIVTMNQKRRLRIGEVHYLDHPKLGTLVLVQRANAPAN